MTADVTKTYPYKFSVVSAVYKVEEYLEEYIESLLAQTLDFEHNVQLILVDDGSPDGSGAICDRYAARYPNNVKVVHKENGGVSSARNAGIPLIEGEYVNFCDPDDKLSPDTLEAVYAFFEAHKGETDVVAVPLELFGDATGGHMLNNKFERGDRVISLEEELDCRQLMIASSFIRHEVAREICFNTKLSIAEDAEQLMQIFIRKPYLGVVTGCRYFYRKRGTSAMGATAQKKKWYNDSVRYFSLAVMEQAKAAYGYVPKFVQSVVAYELQWKLNVTEAPLTVLSQQELADYGELLRRAVELIDDDVWLAQQYIIPEVRLKLLAARYPRESLIRAENGDLCYCGASGVFHRFSENMTEYSFLEVGEDAITLSVRQSVLATEHTVDAVYLAVGEGRVDGTVKAKTVGGKCYGTTVFPWYICDFTIPRSMLGKKTAVTLHVVTDGVDVEMKHIVAGAYFAPEPRYRNAYYRSRGLFFRFDGHRLTVEKGSRLKSMRQEIRFLWELFRSGDFGTKKAVVARMLHWMRLPFCRRRVWILSDRLTKGGDNGEALFRYLHATKYKGAKCFFAINRGASFDKLAPLGNVIEAGSWRYKLLYLRADKIISSHADESGTNPFDYYAAPYKDLLCGKQFVFLQHGVTQQNISTWLNKYNKNIKGFTCAAHPEYASVLNTPSYFYGEREVWLTGFARFDRLYRDEKRLITIMPTWRKYLMVDIDRQTGVWSVGSQFASSAYFRFYNALINDERLLSAAREYGYTVCYLPHPNTITQIDLFGRDERVRFFNADTEYRDVYAQSDLILTDYSSAAFDFAYMRKPIVYAQFDHETFFGGAHIGEKSYFDYERDGFGEVTYDLESTVALLIDYMKNGCALKDCYRERIDRFFAFNDQNNCKRILDAIQRMDE
ncbi:MAG: CDP-glycerol glycerophosphotransferase family protein [Clostridia bacterium]|nr:CDP-glycerol glycerophosphotransferase family protein [Clostridia bacterium]